MSDTTTDTKIFTKQSVGILILSLLTMATGIVSPAANAIRESFPEISQTMADQVASIPSFAMAVFIVVSSWIVRKVGTKKTVLIGLWMVIISTVLSLVAWNIWVLLGARLLLGAGLGTYNSLAVSLITVSYQGDRQSRLLGWQNAFQGIGATVGSILVSLLLLLNWHAVFAIYLVAVLVLIFYQAHVPDIPLAGDTAETADSNAPTTTNWWVVAGSGVMTFVLMTSYMVSVVKLPEYLKVYDIANASVSSLLIGAINFVVIIAGIAYGRVFAALRYHTITLATALMAVAYLLLALSPSLVSAVVSCVLIGFAFGFFVPWTFGAASNATSAANSDNVTKVMMVLNNLANFLAPFTVIALLMGHAANSLTTVFLNGFIVLVVVLVIVVALAFVNAARSRK